jgi:hypothetical protein
MHACFRMTAPGGLLEEDMAENTHSVRSPIVARATPRSDVVTLDPRTIVLAISFHLLDEGMTTELDTAALVPIRTRLERRQTRLVIPRHQWHEMTNPERLGWLLFETRIELSLSSEGRAVLTLPRD